MKFETLLAHCTEVMKIILKSNQPPDNILTQYFSKKKYIGSKERKIISEIIFIHLRFLGLSEYFFSLLNSNAMPNTINNTLFLKILLSLTVNVLLYHNNLGTIYENIENLYILNKGDDYLKKIIIDLINKKFNFEETKKIILEFENKILPQKNSIQNIRELSARYSIPQFILQSWISYYPKLNIDPLEIAESLLFPSQTTIRINKPNLHRELIIDKFMQEGVVCFPTKYSPFGITFSKRYGLTQHPLYRDGTIEIQDEGSQLICIACDPKKNDKILDACAGAGGKSLLLAFLQEDKGEIFANDINILKLKELKKRANRSGYSSIKTHHHHPKSRSSLKENYFDIVLVDAPCSGIGTARRNPMHKWWLTPEKLKRISQKQFELLEYYSRFVRTGGSLVYSTCSLMPEENQYVVDKFLKKYRNFVPEPLSYSFKKYSINLPLLDEESHQITLLPHIHGTDGFFIAKFKKAT